MPGFSWSTAFEKKKLTLVQTVCLATGFTPYKVLLCHLFHNPQWQRIEKKNERMFQTPAKCVQNFLPKKYFGRFFYFHFSSTCLFCVHIFFFSICVRIVRIGHPAGKHRKRICVCLVKVKSSGNRFKPFWKSRHDVKKKQHLPTKENLKKRQKYERRSENRKHAAKTFQRPFKYAWLWFFNYAMYIQYIWQL